MRKRQFFWASLAIVALLAGCKPPGPQPTSQPAADLTPKSSSPYGPRSAAELNALPDTDKPFVPDLKGADEQALEKATKDYAHALEILMEKRAANGAHFGTIPPGATGTNGAEPSGVHFDPVHPPRSPDAPGANVPNNASTAGATISGNDAHGPAHEQVAIAPQPVPTPIQPGPTVTETPPRQDVPFNKDTPGSNVPLIVAQPRPLTPTDVIANRLAKQVKDYPQDVASQLDWQLMQMLQGQSVPQLQTLSTLQAEDREMLSAVLDGITNFRNALKADNNMLLSRKIRPMLEVSDRLRTQAELSIPTIALCTDVKGFGVYEPLEPARFPADNKEHRVIVYCEVENFASQLDEQKRWQTKLTQEVVLYTEQNGLEVWRDTTPQHPIIDYSRNRRHDFFIVKMVRIPANLTIGRYLLKVTVTDQEVNRVAENTVPITIVAQ